MNAAVIALAVSGGLGLLVFILGFRPAPEQDAAPGAPGAPKGPRQRMRPLRSIGQMIQNELRGKEELVQDALMVGRTLEAHALNKFTGLIVGLVLTVGTGMALSLFGLGLSPLILVIAAGVGCLLGWWLPDSILHTEAEKERQYFQQVTESWLELASQLVTAGSDTFAALMTAASYSEQPVFVIIRNSLREAAARGEPPWNGLRKMSQERRLRFLDPFCASLELAGTTGAESRQTILAQVEASRAKALFEADAAAASSGEKMGAPLALIGGAFMVLMGYPPMAQIMDSATISGI